MKRELIDRQMKTATKIFFEKYSEQILEMIYQGYKDGILHNPRFVMYKLLAHGVTKKDVKKVGATIAALKYQGRLPNHYTIDTTRSISDFNSFRDAEELLHYAAEWFYLDRWKEQPYNILLMCEASGYLGVIRKIANDFRIPYVPAKGDMSIQLKIDIAQSITRPTKVLYYGDYDKKGMQIPRTIEADMRLINPSAEFEFIRMFINEEDIIKYDLEKDDQGNVQMEQLPENVAIYESKRFINNIIDQELWSSTIQLEEDAREEIRSYKIGA